MAKHRERLRLGRDDREPDVERELAGAALGHQGELVDRQRPTSRRRHDEGDPPRLVRSPPAQQRIDVDRLAGRSQGLGVAERGPWFRANADDRDVELDADAVIKIGRVASGIDVPQALLDERPALVRDQ